MRKPKRSPVVVIEREMIESPAFGELTATAIRVLLRFLSKRVMSKRRSGSKRAAWDIVNNGQITYPYAEAERQGIPRSGFQRALDLLIERGFIDVAGTGMGVLKSATLYSVSDRWRSLDKEGIILRHRPRKARWAKGVGFQPGHPHYPKRGNDEQGAPASAAHPPEPPRA